MVALVNNAKRRTTSPLKVDPTRTATLRRRFTADVNRRFAKLAKAIVQLVVEEDAFGLTVKRPFTFNVRWQFHTDVNKTTAFQQWLKGQVDAGVLSVDGHGDPWTATYIHSAYRQGIVRGYADTKGLGAVPDAFAAGSQAEFLRAVFAAPETLSKIQLLATRPYENLRGITAQMGAQMNRVLAGGIANGLHPTEIARQLVNEVGIARTRANTIARTEIVHAHAEGQLDSFERLGVEDVGIMVEWQTAGDDRVCPKCSALDGIVLSVAESRGILPRHPNCRCAFVPAFKDKAEAAQKRTKSEIDQAIKDSIKGEKNPSWFGADKTFDGVSSTPPALPKSVVPKPGTLKGTSPAGQEVSFVPSGGKNPPGSVTVMVDPRKLDAVWAATSPGQYIPPGGGGAEIGGRRVGFTTFLERKVPVQASRVNLFGKDRQVNFSDGRHRFSVMRDLGFDQVAVTVPRNQAKEFVRRFGPGVTTAP